jgi:hypothetical protein
VPLVGVVYEATDATATDRDVLGRLALPIDWHATHPGPYTLEASCSAAFDLTFAIVDGSERLKLVLDEPKPTVMAPPRPGPPSFPERDIELACMVKTSAGGTLVPMRAIKIGGASITLEGRALPAGPVEIMVRRGRDIHAIKGHVDVDKSRVARLEPGDALTKLLATFA